jgi:hypothetical protein
MQIILFALIGFGLSVIGLVFLILSLRWIQGDAVTDRLKEYVADTTSDGRRWRSRGAAAPRELTGSLVTRLIMPVVRGVGSFLGRLTPSGAIDNISHQLLVAGNPSNLGAGVYGINGDDDPGGVACRHVLTARLQLA